MLVSTGFLTIDMKATSEMGKLPASNRIVEDI